MYKKAPRKTTSEQLKLIMECRASGLPDAQWCKQNGIIPQTFYNWVTRLRKKGYTEIPERNTKTELIPAFHQDVVKVEVLPEPELGYSPVPVIDKPNLDNCIVAEVKIGNANLKIMEGMSSELLKVMLHELKGDQNVR